MKFTCMMTHTMISGLVFLAVGCFSNDVRLYVEVDESCQTCCSQQRFGVFAGGNEEGTVAVGKEIMIEREADTKDELLQVMIVNDDDVTAEDRISCYACITPNISKEAGMEERGELFVIHEEVSFINDDLHRSVSCESQTADQVDQVDTENAPGAEQPDSDTTEEIPESGFLNNNDGTVSDFTTGLMWVQDSQGSANKWKNAKSYCENLMTGGYIDWRMPTLEETRTILSSSEGSGGDGKSGVCYWNSAFSGQCRNMPFWTDTEISDDEVMVVGFYVGRSYDSLKSEMRHVRCVR